MDEEALERISDVADINLLLAGAVLEELEKLGYHKLPKGKPPLITDAEAIACIKQDHPRTVFNLTWQATSIKQAQREANIKWYEG